MSPWDFEPINEATLPPDTSQCTQVSIDEIRSVMYQPCADEWPAHGRDVECERLIAGLQQIMSLSVAEPFLAPVDLNDFPTYAIMIEYPIDLSLIRERLDNRFYRRVTAVQYDVRYIELNAEKFNVPESEIVIQAKTVTELCLLLLNNPDCNDVMPIYTELSKRDEFRISAQESASDSEDSGPCTSTKPAPVMRRRTSRMRRRSSTQKSCATSASSWVDDCRALLMYMLSHPDSEPFRSPVNTEMYPEYLTLIDHPMDLGTIRKHLQDDDYTNPKDFFKDVQLVFTNSKAYNTNKRSRIYLMTLRLRSLFEEKRDELVTKWKRRRLRQPRKPLPRHARRQSSSDAQPSNANHTVNSRVLKLKLNAQRSFMTSSTSASQPGPSSLQPRNGFSMRPRSERIGNRTFTPNFCSYNGI